MYLARKPLSRRTVLRGMGVSLALPLLDAMVPAFSVTARTAANPARRLGFVYCPNGVSMNFSGVNYWKPKGLGENFELSWMKQLCVHQQFAPGMAAVSALMASLASARRTS